MRNEKRRLRVVSFGLGLLVLFATACTPGAAVEAPADEPELVLGQLIYTNNCASCHRPDGRGGRGVQLNEGKVIENFANPADQLALIANGRGQMPAYSARLTAEQLDAVVRYTREVLNTAAAGE